MRFTIQKEVFLKGLSKVQGIVEKRSTIPILSNVLIEATSDSICLMATDLEVGMKDSFPAQVSEPGKITVSAKKIFEIVRELPEGEVAFTAKENCWIELRSGKAFFNIVGLSSEEFPFFPQQDESSAVVLDSERLKEMLDRTLFAVSTDETKFNLNGIFFHRQGSATEPFLRLVATDGHRLSLIERQITLPDMPELEKGVILPRKGLMELRKLADEGSGEIALSFFQNNAVVKKGTTTVIMRLVDGDYPDYTRVIPKTEDNQAIVPRDLFLAALRRMSTLSSEKSKGVKLSIKPASLEISSSNPDFGDAREDLEVDYQGPEFSIGFNARYLLDVLQAVQEESISLIFKDNLSPTLIRIPDQPNYLAVVMPMRL